MPENYEKACAHCKRGFASNDTLRYLSQVSVYTLVCDICEEINYLTDQKHKPFLLALSVFLGLLAILPFFGGLWYFWSP